MTERKIDCQTYIFRDVVLDEDRSLISLNESPFPRHDVLFPEDSSVVVRNIDAVRFGDIDSYPNGGFRLRKWLEIEDDGHEALKHYHLELLPRFNKDSINFINQKLETKRIAQRIQTAATLSDVLPTISICPNLGISLAANGKRFFSYTADGHVNVNPKMKRKFREVYDADSNPPVHRFLAQLKDIEEEKEGERPTVYRVLAYGEVRTTDLADISDLLDIPVTLGTLRPDDAESTRLLDSIAILQVSIAQRKLKP